jgi:diacylglycerol kinase
VLLDTLVAECLLIFFFFLSASIDVCFVSAFCLLSVYLFVTALEKLQRLHSDCTAILQRLRSDCAATAQQFCSDNAAIMQRLLSDFTAIAQRLRSNFAATAQ